MSGLSITELKKNLDTMLQKIYLLLLVFQLAQRIKKDKTPVITNDLRNLKELNLPTYDYQQIIVLIINEIRNRDRFKL